MQHRAYVIGDGVIEMPPAGLPDGTPRLVPANDATYEGLGIFVNDVDSRGKKTCEIGVIRDWSSLVVARKASGLSRFPGVRIA